MSDNLPWKTWTPDDLAPPQAEFVPMVEPEETIIEEAEPSLEQQQGKLILDKTISLINWELNSTEVMKIKLQEKLKIDHNYKK